MKIQIAWIASIVASVAHLSLENAKAQIWQESFSYPDQTSLTLVESGWSTHSGTPGESQIFNQSLSLNQSLSEDLNHPIQPLENQMDLYGITTRLTLEFLEAPTTKGSFFFHYKNSGSTFAGRLFAQRSAEDENTLLLGISNRASTADILHPTSIQLQQIVEVFVSHHPVSGLTRLWINPLTEESASVQASDPPREIELESVAFRQTSGIGSLRIHHLEVSPQWNDLLPPSISQPIIRRSPLSQSLELGDPLILDVEVSSIEPIDYLWYFNEIPIPNSNAPQLKVETIEEANFGNYSVTASNSYGTVTSLTAIISRKEPPIASTPPTLTWEAFAMADTWETPVPIQSLQWPLHSGQRFHLEVRITDATEFTATPASLWIESPRNIPSELSPLELVLDLQDTQLEEGIPLTLQVRAKNELGETQSEWILYRPTDFERDLHFTEILPHPTNDPSNPRYNPLHRHQPSMDRSSVEDEYIELQSRGSKALNLEGWTLSDLTKIRHRFEPGTVLEPGQGLLVYGGTQSGSLPNLPVASFPASESASQGLSLNNGGDEIRLDNAQGNPIRIFRYDTLTDILGSLLPDSIHPAQYQDHAQVSDRVTSPGTHSDGSDFEIIHQNEPGQRLEIIASPTPIVSFRLRWKSTPESTYSIWYAPAPSGTFEPLALISASADSDFLEWPSEPDATLQPGFYRLTQP